MLFKAIDRNYFDVADSLITIPRSISYVYTYYVYKFMYCLFFNIVDRIVRCCCCFWAKM